MLQMGKGQSLPVSTAHAYQDMLHKERAQWELEQEYLRSRSRSRSQTPEPAERPRSLSAGGATRVRYSHSPERPDSRGAPHHNLNTIPENPRLLANGFREAMNGGHYETLASAQHQARPGHGHGIYESVYQSGYGAPHQQAYMTHSGRSTPQSQRNAAQHDPRKFI